MLRRRPMTIVVRGRDYKAKLLSNSSSSPPLGTSLFEIYKRITHTRPAAS